MPLSLLVLGLMDASGVASMGMGLVADARMEMVEPCASAFVALTICGSVLSIVVAVVAFFAIFLRSEFTTTANINFDGESSICGK